MTAIALFTPAWSGSNTPNGITTSVYNLALGLIEIGVTPVILAERLDGDAPASIPVIEVSNKLNIIEKVRFKLGIPISHARMRGQRITDACRTAIEKYNVDALIIEETQGWAFEVQKHVPCPVIVTLHGPWFMHKALQSDDANLDQAREDREARALRHVAGITAPSADVLSATLAELPDLSRKPSVVIANALQPSPKCAGNRPADILFIGRYDRHKGGDTVLEAFALFAEQVPDVRLTFVGPDRGFTQDNGQVQHITEALAALPAHVRDRITYTGPLDRDSVQEMRDRHQIAVIASRYEIFGYTVLEAMNASQAIISSDIGGPSEILDHEKTALLVPVADVDAFAQALVRLHQDLSLRDTLGDAAKRKLIDEFSPKIIAEQTIKFINSL